MPVYLLKWNPKRFQWNTLASDADQVRRKGFLDDSWSCGNTERIEKGDRVFLLRAGVPPRGIVASGSVITKPYKAAHYARRGKALYVDVRFDTILDPERESILTVDRLRSRALAEFIGRIQYAPKSGLTIPADAAAELEAVWADFLAAHGQRPIFSADEVITPARFVEGATRQISVNTYERNPYARERCIEHYGCRCSVCDFDFEKVFGRLGRGFIHVHHLKPLSQIQEEYEIDPIADLRPICPNCHEMIHREKGMLTIADLKKLIQSRSSQQHHSVT